jgi:hypothetical protein
MNRNPFYLIAAISALIFEFTGLYVRCDTIMKYYRGFYEF